MNGKLQSPTGASPRRRLTSLLWALAFVLGTVGEGFALHPCPHHEGLAAHAEAAPGDLPGTDEAHPHGHHHPAEHSEEGHHGGVVHAAGDCHSHAGGPAATDGSSHGEHSGPCTCGSACQATAGVAMPSVPVAPLVDVAVVPQRVLLPVTQAPIPGRPPFFLPLAQAPPTTG